MVKSDKRRKPSVTVADKSTAKKKKKDKKGASRIDPDVDSSDHRPKFESKGSDQSDSKDGKPKIRGKSKQYKETERSVLKPEFSISEGSYYPNDLGALGKMTKRNSKKRKKTQPSRDTIILQLKTPLEIAMDEEELSQKDRELIERAKTCYEEADLIWETAWSIISERFYVKYAPLLIALELRDTWLHLAHQQWMDEDFRDGSYLPDKVLVNDNPSLPLVFDSWSRGAIEVLPATKRESVLDPFIRDNSNFLTTDGSDTDTGHIKKIPKIIGDLTMDNIQATDEDKDTVRSAHVRRKSLFSENPHQSFKILVRRDDAAHPSTAVAAASAPSSALEEEFGSEEEQTESDMFVSSIFGKPVETESDEEWLTILNHEHQGSVEASFNKLNVDHAHNKTISEHREEFGHAIDNNLHPQREKVPDIFEENPAIDSNEDAGFKIVIATPKTSEKQMEPKTEDKPKQMSPVHGFSSPELPTSHEYHEQPSPGSLSSSEIKDVLKYNRANWITEENKRNSQEEKHEIVQTLKKKSFQHIDELEKGDIHNHPLSLHRAPKVPLFDKDKPLGTQDHAKGDKVLPPYGHGQVSSNPPVISRQMLPKFSIVGGQLLPKPSALSGQLLYDARLLARASMSHSRMPSHNHTSTMTNSRPSQQSSAALTDIEQYAGMSPTSSSDGYSSDGSYSSNSSSGSGSFQSTLSSNRGE